MSKIKTYNLFLESNKEVDIYEFANMLKGWQPYPPLSEVRRHSERFIGPGIYDRVEKLVNKIFEVFRYIDLEYIKEALYDIFDEFTSKDNRVHLCVLYCNPDLLKKPIVRRYNGSIGIGDNKEKYKTHIICHILLDMLSPTFSLGYPSLQIRQTDEQIDVTDPKWNCVNFNIDNYEISKKEGQYVPVPSDYKKRETYISPIDLDKLRKYNIEDFFKCYEPGIYIELYDEERTGSKMNIKEIENLFDKYLPHILNEIEWEEILWEIPREGRQFDETKYDLDDFSLRILLKM